MTSDKTLYRLESQLVQLVETMLVRRQNQVDFLVGLNHLDNILIELADGRPVIDQMTTFLQTHRHWVENGKLNSGQKHRLGQFLSQVIDRLLSRNDTDHFKLAETIKEWSQKLGTGSFRLTIKGPGEQATLADRFYSLVRREAEEMNMLLAERGHLLTCLDDLLKSAESKNDRMYHHLAASLIYFLKLEGYKVDPYINRLRQLREDF